MASWTALAIVVGLIGSVVFLPDSVGLMAVSALLALCGVVAAPAVPAMKKASEKLLDNTLVRHHELQDLQQQLETLIRQPFAPDPWAPLRATVASPSAESDHCGTDPTHNREKSVDIPSDAEALAGVLAGALVKSMVSDTWSAARTWFKNFAARHRGSTAEKDTARLDAAQQALAALSEKDRAALTQKLMADWSVRLSDVLADHPEAITEAQKFVAQQAAAHPTPTIGHTVTITATADNQATQTIAGIGNIGTDPGK